MIIVCYCFDRLITRIENVKGMRMLRRNKGSDLHVCACFWLVYVA